MAVLLDIPVAVFKVGPIEFGRRIYKKINEDNLFTWAAALAYSWLFAIFPFVIFLLTLVPYAPLTFQRSVVHGIEHLITQQLPGEAGVTMRTNVNAMLQGIMSRPRGGVLSAGLMLTIWAASGGMSATMSALDRVYEVSEGRSYLKRRLWAIIITMFTASAVLAVLILLPIGTVATHLAQKYYPGQFSLGLFKAWHLVRYASALVLMLVVLAVIYRWAPSIQQRVHFFTPGSVLSLGVWVLLEELLRVYVSAYSHYDKTYGTVAGVALILLVFYLDALVLLIGAAVNAEIDFACGVKRGSRDFRRTSK